MKNSKFYLVLIGLSGMCLVIFLVLFGVRNKDIGRIEQENMKNKLRYVLVNEDNGALFNGKRYLLGQDMVKLISNDQDHNWQTASYDMAQAGMKKGVYDVEVVIPADFSKKLLALESPAPKQAGLTYRVRAGQNAVTAQIIGRKMDELVKYFNSRVVRMYFSSLIGNLHNAQLAMADSAVKQNQQTDSLATNIQRPFQGLKDQFTAIFQTASILDQAGIADDEVTQAFGKELQDLLQESAQTTHQDQLEQLQQQAELYTEMTAQSEAYRLKVAAPFTETKRFSTIVERAQNTFAQLTAEQQQTKQQTTDQLATLTTLKKQLEQEYGLGQKTAQVELAALTDRLKESTATKTKTLEKFTQATKEKLATLPVATDLEQQDTLGIAPNEQADYQAAVKLLTKYAQSFKTTYGQKKMTYLTTRPLTYESTVTFDLPAERPVILQFEGPKATVSLNKEDLVKSLEQAGYQKINVSELQAGSFQVQFATPHQQESSSSEKQESSSEKTETSQTSSSTQSETSESKVPSETTSAESISVRQVNTAEHASEEKTFSEQRSQAVTLKVKYTFAQTGTYHWTVNGIVQNDGQVVVEKDKQNSELTQNVIQTLALANELKAVYGDPKSDLSTFLGQQTSAQFQALPGSFAENSTPDDELTPLLQQHAQNLLTQYQAITTQLKQLEQLEAPATKRPALTEASQAELNELDQLTAWYNQASQALLTEPGSAKNQAQTPPAGEKNDLVAQYRVLQNSLSQRRQTEQSQLRPVITTLTADTNKLKEKTTLITSELERDLKVGRRQAKNTNEQAKRFGQVMQNTRNGEADDQQVYNFLTDPLKAKGTYAVTQKTTPLPYFLTLIGTVAALVVSSLSLKYLPHRKVTAENALKEQTRPWLNLPSVGFSALLGLMLGGALSLSMLNALNKAQLGPFSLYTLSILVLLTSLFSLGLRLQREVTLFLSGLVLSLYLLLTPFVGNLLHAGSLVQNLYRFSPLQNIESGYAILVNGGNLGWPTWLGLSLGLLGVLGGSLFLPCSLKGAKMADET